jgi:diguanylate cyclase (GGDEF)-like protein/PAS domain S-box-containing protein
MVTEQSEMNLFCPIDLELVELRTQLFRYAEDLQDLLQQHSNLQQRHQEMLKALGRGDEEGDLILNSLLESSNLHLITNTQGGIVFSSTVADRTIFAGQVNAQVGTIMQLVAAEQVSATQDLLKSFTTAENKNAIHQRKLVLRCGSGDQSVRIFETLIMQGHRQNHTQIYWFLSNETPFDANLRNPKQAFPALQDSNEGLMITDTLGKICAVNAAFSQITGYGEDHILGGSPRQLSSGLQDKQFYQSLWHQLLKQGSWSGALLNRRASGAIYFTWMSIKAVLDATGATVYYMAIFVDKSLAENDQKKLSLLAFHDPLTGLPNRWLMEKRLMQAITRAESSGVGLFILLLSLHQLRNINDDMGRETGDLVLQEVAARLQATVRRGDTVARTGSDEFMIILPNIDLRAVAEQLANDLLSEIIRPINIGTHQLVMRAIIGAVAFPQDGTNVPTILKCADAALFGAKAFGNQLCFYETAQTFNAIPGL